MSPQRPASVTGAIWLLVGLIVWTGITAVLTVAFRSDLVDAWAEGRGDTGSVEPPAFVPVAVVMFVVFALLAIVLIMFFHEGHQWARVLLTMVVVVMALATLALSVRNQPPALFLVLLLVSLALEGAVLVCLWHRDTSVFVSAPVRHVGQSSS